MTARIPGLPTRPLAGPLRWPARFVDERYPAGRLRALLTAVLAVLAAVLLGLAVISGLAVLDQDRAGSASAAGRAAAVELTPRLLTYDYRTLPADTERAVQATTGAFAGQYRTLAERYLGPNAGGQQFVTRAEVKDAAVVAARSDEVVVLLFVSQVTTSRTLTAPRLDNSGVRVTMSEVDGRWLISQLDRV